MREIKEANKEVIIQLCDLIQQISNEQYAQKIQILSGSSVGMHVRHILEFYNCFLSNIKNNEVCYDKRERKLIYEIDIESTVSEFNIVSEKIDSLTENKVIEINVNPNSEDFKSAKIPSYLFRELLYTMDHAIHHMALIKIGFKTTFPKIEVSNKFGVAPSTVRYRKEKCAQ